MSKLTTVVLAAALVLNGCDNRPDQWDAFIYQEGEFAPVATIRGFKSFELCKQAALDRLSSMPDKEKLYFDCGYQCGIHPDYHMEVCKETKD